MLLLLIQCRAIELVSHKDRFHLLQTRVVRRIERHHPLVHTVGMVHDQLFHHMACHLLLLAAALAGTGSEKLLVTVLTGASHLMRIGVTVRHGLVFQLVITCLQSHLLPLVLHHNKQQDDDVDNEETQSSHNHVVQGGGRVIGRGVGLAGDRDCASRGLVFQGDGRRLR